MDRQIMKNTLKSGVKSSHLHKGVFLAAFAFLLVALPVWAAHSDSMSWELHASTTIGSTQVNPGLYIFKAEEGQSELLIMQNGKVIARVPCSWTPIANKAAYSEVKTLDNQIILLQFAGRKEVIQFNP